ncbi:MAG: oxidoreductase [Clostridiales bacterium GWC2_40_7]|nr:MAG: oxidoreductase [Clostridiales bacterium GWC2_40_7]
MCKTKIAIIGLGDMGTGHLNGFSALKEAEIVSLCDQDKNAIGRALGNIKNNNPTTYTNHKEMLENEDIDGVVIAVPGFLHEAIVMDCLEHKKQIFLEKPVTVDYEGFKRIQKAKNDSNCIIQVGLVYRYSHLYRTMAQKLNEQKELGNVMLAWCKEFRQCFPQEEWFYDETKSGGTLVEKDCHHFDIFNWMIGSHPKRVYAMGGQHVYKNGQENLIDCSYSIREPKVINQISIVDHAFVTIEYENGAKAQLGLCMYLKPMNNSGDGLEIGFIGDNGRQLIARMDESFSIFGGEFNDKVEYKLDVVSDNQGFGHIGCQTQRLEFIDCILSGKQPAASIEQTKDAFLIALAAERSIKENRVVVIDEFK